MIKMNMTVLFYQPGIQLPHYQDFCLGQSLLMEQTSKSNGMKRLYRLKNQRMLGGVCGGIGEHFDVDPTVIRLVWAVLTLLSVGIGIIAYIIAWIIIPEEGSSDEGNSPLT
jgi:phage shock protein C